MIIIIFRMMKSHQKIKEQIEFWFLKYHGKEKSDFNGKEIFTLYDLLSDDLKTELNKSLQSGSEDIPVLFFKVKDGEYIVNTTSRFLKIDASSVDEISYINFDRHVGFKAKVINEDTGEPVSVKKSGVLSEFGVKSKDGIVKYWRMPSGRPAFGFWNITDKCELVGRKYLT